MDSSAGAAAASLTTTSVDDRALVERLRAGDEAAYETMVRSYGGRMLAVARRMLPNEDDAQEALQDAFLSAFRGIEGFGGDSQLSTWLHRIVVNAALMKLRTRRRKPERSIEELLPRFQDDGHHANPVREWREVAGGGAIRAEVRSLVRRQIDELPEPYREVLLLRDIEGFDTEQTAEALGLTPGAVKTRLHRARMALRELLDPYLRGGDV